MLGKTSAGMILLFHKKGNCEAVVVKRSGARCKMFHPVLDETII